MFKLWRAKCQNWEEEAVLVKSLDAYRLEQRQSEQSEYGELPIKKEYRYKDEKLYWIVDMNNPAKDVELSVYTFGNVGGNQGFVEPDGLQMKHLRHADEHGKYYTPEDMHMFQLWWAKVKNWEKKAVLAEFEDEESQKVKQEMEWPKTMVPASPASDCSTVVWPASPASDGAMDVERLADFELDGRGERKRYVMSSSPDVMSSSKKLMLSKAKHEQHQGIELMAY